MRFLIQWGKKEPLEVTESELFDNLGIIVRPLDYATRRAMLTNVRAPYPVTVADHARVPFSISRVITPGDLIRLGNILIRCLSLGRSSRLSSSPLIA